LHAKDEASETTDQIELKIIKRFPILPFKRINLKAVDIFEDLGVNTTIIKIKKIQSKDN